MPEETEGFTVKKEDHSFLGGIRTFVSFLDLPAGLVFVALCGCS